MHEHEVIRYRGSEDQPFIAEAPKFPGCMAHGDDQEAALRNIKDAMQFRIERAPRSGTGKDTLKQQASPLADAARIEKTLRANLTSGR